MHLLAGASSADAEVQWQVLARVVLAWAADPASLALALAEDRPPQLHLPRPSGKAAGQQAFVCTLDCECGTAAAQMMLVQAEASSGCAALAGWSTFRLPLGSLQAPAQALQQPPPPRSAS